MTITIIDILINNVLRKRIFTEYITDDVEKFRKEVKAIANKRYKADCRVCFNLRKNT